MFGAGVEGGGCCGAFYDGGVGVGGGALMLAGEAVDGFGEAAAQDLHYAVGVCVVVDLEVYHEYFTMSRLPAAMQTRYIMSYRRSFPRRPNKNK